MHQLTVLIPCKNEIENLADCVASVRRIADEVLVADSGSTDGTLELAAELGCRTIEREYIHSGDFKNWAIPQARHQWVLLLDADERGSDALCDEVTTTLREPIQDGYFIYRTNHFMGHRIRYSGWNNDKVLRLFRRDVSRYVGDTDHAEIEVDSGHVGYLESRLLHYTYWSYDQYLAKMQRYTTHQARVWKTQGRRPSFVRMLTTIPLRFLHTYVIRGGFLDGQAGLQVCAMTAFYSFLKQARLWELSQAPNLASHPAQRRPSHERKAA